MKIKQSHSLWVKKDKKLGEYFSYSHGKRLEKFLHARILQDKTYQLKCLKEDHAPIKNVM